MRRFFRCKLERTDDIVVRVETDETGDITNRVCLSEKLLKHWFGSDWYRMELVDVEETTEQAALVETATGRMCDVPTAEVLEDDEG